MKLNPLAQELNQLIEQEAPILYSLLSDYGKRLFFPKGIISQSAEAKELAKNYNATIGIATENKVPMHLNCVGRFFDEGLTPQELYPYAPTTGLMQLRVFWKEKQEQENPSMRGKVTSLPVVTNALSHGLSLAGELFCEEGTRLVLADQYWGNYKFLWGMKSKCELVTFPLFDDQLESFNFDAFRDTLKRYEGEKFVVALNFPNNPTGYLPTKKEAESIRKILVEAADRGSRMIVICDDAYFGMTWEEQCLQESMFGLLADAHPKLLAVKVDGCTKEGFMWGFRVGFLTLAMKGVPKKVFDAVEKKIGGAIRASIASVNLPGQTILLKAFRSDTYHRELQEKKNILRERYDATKRSVYLPQYASLWDVYPFQSGYFMTLRLKNVNAETLRLHLLEKYGLGVISVNDSDLRIAFSCLEKEDISKVFELIARGIRDILAR
ncbi:MAG: aminotransferase class I/II-fold pyridoxal phosphate-dependent enzyme [Deltaproteobacteria bacterium]|nr:aminotransferase class I/II-fold pyridoxal phosphate-dependent enzyme [Deltaproteobacteria bacterium]